MNGFIHSLSATEPADELVRPLAPRLWRSDLAPRPLDRALALGARYQLVLSDLWGYPSGNWNGRGPPWADLAAWERFVRRVAREHEGKAISWDIWNEPNGAAFWSGGRERFFRTYSVANRVLREELGDDVEIVGPSVSRYSPRWIDAFLGHCLAARCRIAALAWHENLRPEDPLEGIAAHLSDARSRVLADPRYAELGMRQIHVNEYTGAVDRYLPGEAVAYLSQLEAGDADLAALSCWTAEDCAPSGLGGPVHLFRKPPREPGVGDDLRLEPPLRPPHEGNRRIPGICRWSPSGSRAILTPTSLPTESPRPRRRSSIQRDSILCLIPRVGDSEKYIDPIRPRWVRRDELASLEFPPADAELIQILKQPLG